ncbi:fumarylacetoacetate hydrolase family protein [Sinorhizobium garamanticum]|uniref:Fumarylacetoacetate hydrolase family protein n=1 Tax=Sinorhizobium garamanticum TaxID=680247 RepID=A0ABY8DQA0_9HYPH|nr:fumarylacetoacetate hydrolase family protein [Sinorhizobium garamanticum]WEX91136.1 fumarylacetoacetate hydrolase family protein [Sinorhizobium garamanticum]
MSYAFKPAAVTALPIRNTLDLFPLRRVYCVGRNYADHAIEMGHDPDREAPFFFQKNPDNLVLDGEFPYPSRTSDVHHEIELVVCLGRGGENIPVDQALSHVYGYAIGLDMTRRDLQNEAKKMGRPWEVAKAFEKSAPVSPIVRASEIGHLEAGAIWLKVNGELRQSGDLNQMIWKVPEAISYLSGLFQLAPGDIIMTGTPAGVGPVKRGDRLEGHVDGLRELTVTVV